MQDDSNLRQHPKNKRLQEKNMLLYLPLPISGTVSTLSAYIILTPTTYIPILLILIPQHTFFSPFQSFLVRCAVMPL